MQGLEAVVACRTDVELRRKHPQNAYACGNEGEQAQQAKDGPCGKLRAAEVSERHDGPCQRGYDAEPDRGSEEQEKHAAERPHGCAAGTGLEGASAGKNRSRTLENASTGAGCRLSGASAGTRRFSIHTMPYQRPNL